MFIVIPRSQFSLISLQFSVRLLELLLFWVDLLSVADMDLKFIVLGRSLIDGIESPNCFR
ncbi:hypothetical protein Lal_00036694 [Lupinus albus]|nr:hypothetical protein Lal_00036694 [Lupinus albus]